MNIAAVWEMILACEWGRIWWGITHAHWANVWASVSAIFTTMAVIVAGWAMVRWKKQDELKVKLAFKVAISQYCYALLHLPEKLNGQKDIIANQAKISELIDKFNACYNAWMVTEGLLDKNKAVKDGWAFLYDNHQHFVKGEINSNILASACVEIMDNKFVFK
jgi:hypothetical protein